MSKRNSAGSDTGTARVYRALSWQLLGACGNKARATGGVARRQVGRFITGAV